MEESKPHSQAIAVFQVSAWSFPDRPSVHIWGSLDSSQAQQLGEFKIFVPATSAAIKLSPSASYVASCKLEIGSVRSMKDG